jgi:hypothetical protein
MQLLIGADETFDDSSPSVPPSNFRVGVAEAFSLTSQFCDRGLNSVLTATTAGRPPPPILSKSLC